MTRFLSRIFYVVAILIAVTVNPLFAQDDLINGENGDGEETSGPIEEYVADFEMTEGLFTYYTEPDTRRVLISLNEDQIDQIFLGSATLSGGTGGRGMMAPMMWGSTVFEFRRDAQSIEFVEPNYQITTVMGEPMAGAVESGTSDYYFGRTPIEVEDEDDGRVVIDLTSLLLALGGIDASTLMWGYSYSIDYEGSYISEIKGFPLNDEIDIRLIVYGAPNALGYSPEAGQEVWLHISLAVLPDDGYMPRLADERIGYFQDIALKYSVETDREETRYIRYINRWRLEKEDPDSDISRPLKPITFWLENTIPYEYRDAIEEGILAWNPAFKAIGFRNAVRAEIMPDDADWDPADIRYNCIRWFVGPDSVYAIGPSQSDPRTGEIFAADIGVNADMTSSAFRSQQLTIIPLQSMMEMIMPPGWPNLNNRQVRWDQDTLDILDEQAQKYSVDNGCSMYSEMRAFELGRSITLLNTGGIFQGSGVSEEELIHDYLVDLVCHEVGHTLGLRHNFAGSTMTSYWKLNVEWWTREHGLSGSIMDYTSANVSPRGTHQGEFFSSTVGDYDKWAIEYGYIPLDAESPEDELDALQEIASRSGDYRYATDHQVGGWTRNCDPDIHLWDLSDDPIRYGGDMLTVSDQLVENILEYWDEPGTMPSQIRLAFLYAAYDYIRVASTVPKQIGGVRVYHNRVGDTGGLPAMVPVSAEDQRMALIFLRDRIWSSEPFQYDPELLNMLGRDQRSAFNSTVYSGLWDFDVHDWVLTAQTSPFYWIYDPLVLQRIINNEIRMPEGEGTFTIVELFDFVRNAIWSEVGDGTGIDSFRRNLQRAHLDMISGIYLYPAIGSPEDAISLARHDLLVLKQEISTLLSGDAVLNLDIMTGAHLEECLTRINLALSAQLER